MFLLHIVVFATHAIIIHMQYFPLYSYVYSILTVMFIQAANQLHSERYVNRNYCNHNHNNLYQSSPPPHENSADPMRTGLSATRTNKGKLGSECINLFGRVGVTRSSSC